GRRSSFLTKMDDDFNTGGALSDMYELLRDLNKFVDQHKLEEQAATKAEQVASFQRGVEVLRELSALFGIFRAPAAKSSAAGGGEELVGKLVNFLIQLRAEARQKKDFATSDQIRQSLGAMGVVLEDRKGGTEWRIGS
ncbi:MAG TPA: cysteine--tRNA ligase, partial [Pirellulaceae bacterium]|nr:cysteine--tRNA ligase [Pirellulaceae bacterium]